MDYEAVIGLETHVQLKTQSKMWCGCANTFGAPPNAHVCPVCLGLPGVLPVANEEALRLTALAGFLLGCHIAPQARFDRKNYFYPDMPKNYQITQYAQPSCLNGQVEFEFEGGLARVRITRAHLEEDVGKNFHFERQSGVDFNRAGVPLLEIVSEPDITGAALAYAYLNALKEILVSGGVSDCDMEKGMVRCDVNVSVRPKGATAFGAKIEIKNMNSFSGVRKALEYEIARQIGLRQQGEPLVQSTRRWDDDAGRTEEMRTKEHAHDYRYFPEPDLMPFAPAAAWLAAVKERAVELPLARKQRFMRDYGLPADDARFFAEHRTIGQAFECFAKSVPPGLEDTARQQALKAMANYLVNALCAEFNAAQVEISEFTPESEGLSGFSGYDPNHERKDYLFPKTALFELAAAQVLDSQITSSAVPVIVREMLRTRKSPGDIIREKGLAQVSDAGAVERFCDDAIAANPGPVSDYHSGKTAALNFLKGQVMKLSKGKANPQVAGAILKRKLER